MKKVLVFLIFLTVWLNALPSDIGYFLGRSGLPAKDVSIYIEELGTGRVVASHNASTVRKPASVIKVLTAYTALEAFGFDYRWPTVFYTKGADLYVKGYGDPSLSSEDIPSIVAQLKARGVKQISGNIIIDRSYFDVGNNDSAYFDNNPYSPYNAMPDAMMFNARITTVCIDPRRQSARKEINDHSYKVFNKVKFVNTACRGQYSWAGTKIDLKSPVPTLTLTGALSKRCGERKVCMIVGKPYSAFYYALKEGLEKEGIAVRGGMKLSDVPYDAKLFFTHYSQPLEKIMAKTLKESDNLYARHLLLAVGAKVYGAPATLEKGRKAVTDILRNHGLTGGNTLFIDNGSGLSRKSKMSAATLSNVLQSAYHRYGERWMQTLAVAGIDGTVKRRYRYQAAHNRAWMKTGTVRSVKNIGGYVKNRAGAYYSVVVLVNTNQGTWKGAKLQDDIINWLAKTNKTPSKGEIIHTPQRTVKAPTQQRVSTPAPTSRSKPVQHRSGSYYIQVAAAPNEPGSAYLSRISHAGFNVKVVKEGSYKVLIGAYPNKQSAQRALSAIQQKISKGAFIVTR